MPVKKLVLIPAAKWEQLVKQYNLEMTSDIQDLSLPIPNLKDNEAPLAPPTPVDAVPDEPVDAPPAEDAPQDAPPDAPDDAPPAGGDAPPDAPPAAAPEEAGLRNDAPWLRSERPALNMPPSVGMAYKCDNGKKPKLVRVPKDKKKRKKVRVPKLPTRLKSDFNIRERLESLRNLQRKSYKEDSFDKNAPVENKTPWKSVQKSVRKAMSARKKAQDQMQNNRQEKMTNLQRETRHSRHKKNPVDM